MKTAMQLRRRFLKTTATMAGAALLPSTVFGESSKPASMAFGQGELFSLNDGQLNLPVNMVLPDNLDESAKERYQEHPQINAESYTPDCNVVLWKLEDRIVLFDTGAGSQFPVGGGELVSSLEAIDVDPYDITDVVLTHAHPDHLWGILDDFDDLAFPDAQFHIAEKEWEYWLDSKTLSRTSESRQSFVVGAQNRLPLVEEQVTLFRGGQEIIPGVEAVDSFGHTPGHSSFMLHAGSDSIMVVGDAIANSVLSFENPAWRSNSDQDPDLGVKTRVALLDRLALDKSLMVGYHLPAPGIGYTERSGSSYAFVSS